MGSTFSAKKIIVALDGSEAGKAALRYALDLALALGAKTVAVTAIQTRMPGYRAGYFSFVDRHILKELREFAAGVLEEANRVAGSEPLETATLEGDKEIFEQLADLVEQTQDVAFLVIGSYGHGVRERHILGSTTQRIILEIARRGLSTPVLVVP
jgi:nucleotide-binding universal stress UspA family protein